METEEKKPQAPRTKKQTKRKLEATRYSLKGESIGTEQLPEEVFGQAENDNLLAQYVRVYLINQRQGTASAKTRAEVTGTTKKIYRQKGTGRARHGAAKANLFRGGGVTFGPKPREFSTSLNKKQKKQALFVALSQKAGSGNILLLDTKGIGKEPKTKTVAEALRAIKLEGSVLMVVPQVEKNTFVLSTRNIPGADIIQATTLNPYDVLNHTTVLFVDNALDVIVKHFVPTHENN